MKVPVTIQRVVSASLAQAQREELRAVAATIPTPTHVAPPARAEQPVPQKRAS